ncbi:MAG: hypothetical protein WC661_00975 [Opitutaceae bacterium]|jgi:hypothetical protein
MHTLKSTVATAGLPAVFSLVVAGGVFPGKPDARLNFVFKRYNHVFLAHDIFP